MPLSGLSWFRLKEHFPQVRGRLYHVGVVVAALLTNLLYATTRPQVPDEREVLIYLVDSLASAEPVDAAGGGGARLRPGRGRDAGGRAL